MTDEAKIARREYQRSWNRAHPFKLREYQRRYWEKKAQQLADEKAAAAGEK